MRYPLEVSGTTCTGALAARIVEIKHKCADHEDPETRVPLSGGWPPVALLGDVYKMNTL